MANINDTKELRRFLVEQMEGIAEGTVDLDAAKGITNLAQQIYNTLNIELKFALAEDKVGDVSEIGSPPVKFDG